MSYDWAGNLERSQRDIGSRGDRMAQAVQALLTPATPRETVVFLRQLGDPEIDAMVEKMGFG